jgi:transcription elongation factor SPT6
MAATKIGADDGKHKKSAGRITRRACAHPAFRNEKHNEVDRELREAGDAMVGEALIRPSSKSSDSLAVHWVVRPGVIKVIEVEEEDKDTDASIGNVLKVKDQKYGSIDELLGRNISPMNDFVEELTNHRKFVDITEDELDTKLKEQKEANPKGVFYNLCWDELHPGFASLHFITGSTPRSHPIGIAWNGFTWSSKTYSNLDKLLNDFKKNPRGPSSTRSVASESSSVPLATVPSTVGDSAAKPSRWGAKRAAAPAAPPTNWTQATQVPVAAAQGKSGKASFVIPLFLFSDESFSAVPPLSQQYGISLHRHRRTCHHCQTISSRLPRACHLLPEITGRLRRQVHRRHLLDSLCRRHRPALHLQRFDSLAEYRIYQHG